MGYLNMAWILNDSREVLLMVFWLYSGMSLHLGNAHELLKVECLMSISYFQMDQKKI
jgi:hypothetical protein